MDKKTKMMVLACGVVVLVVVIVLVVMMRNKAVDACKDIKDTDDVASGKMTDACYVQLWKKQGCTTPPTNVKFFPAQAAWNKKKWDDDAHAWATMTDDAHRKGCYGEDKTKWPVLYIRSRRF